MHQMLKLIQVNSDLIQCGSKCQQSCTKDETIMKKLKRPKQSKNMSDFLEKINVNFSSNQTAKLKATTPQIPE